jgi:hypothetical protein
MSSKSVRFGEVVRALVVALVATLIAAVPSAPATAAPDPGQIVYNDAQCQLSTAGYLGDGSQGNPYQISDSDSLWEVADCSITNSAAAYFQITNDIDASNALRAPTSSPIGFSTSTTIPFRGILIGSSFSRSQSDIRGLSISSEVRGVGLFHQVEDSTIVGLSLQGSFISQEHSGNTDRWANAAGSLAARAIGQNAIQLVSNLATVRAPMTSPYAPAGGLVGYAENITIEDSRNEGVISGHDAGGLLGANDGTLTVRYSHNVGAINGYSSNASAGGLIGAAELAGSVRIELSTNTAAITGTNAGGIIGFTERVTTLSSVINEGQIGGNSGGAGGGLIGTSTAFQGVSADLWILDSANHGTVSPVTNVPAGGLVGRINAGSSPTLTVESSTNSGKVSASNHVGGFIGMNYAETQISSSVNQGDIEGQASVGGLIGFWADEALSISDTKNTGIVIGSGQGAGGFVGWATNGPIDVHRSQNHGAIRGQMMVGGFVGQATNGAGITGADLLNLGNISASIQHAGGMAGLTQAVALSRVANLASFVEASQSYAGGFTGETQGTLSLDRGMNHAHISASNAAVGGLAGSATISTILEVYNIGFVPQVSDHDGLVGQRGSVGTVSAYTSVDSALASTSTQAQLRIATTFAGWDFDNAWGFGECNEFGGYPLLRSLNLVTTYYDVSCGVATSVPTPQTPVSGGGSGGATYQGPVLDPITESAVIGQQFVLTGSRLSTIKKIEIGGVEQFIVEATATSITISFSEETELGLADLVITSDFGLLTVQDAIRVLPARTVVESTHLLVGKTKNLSRTPSFYTNWFQANLEGSGLTRVVCTVAVSEDASRSSRIDQRKFAKAVCEEAAKSLVNASVWFQTRVTKHSSQVNRLFITFKG